MIDATDLAELRSDEIASKILTTIPLLVAHIYHRRQASAVKLALGECYPDEWLVKLVRSTGLTASETVREQGGGKPRPYITMDSGDVLSMLRVGLVSAQNMDAPNTEALGTFGDIVEAPNTDALGVPTLNANLRHIVALDTTPLPHTTAKSSSVDMATTHSGYTFTQSTGTSFRIRRTILLPSLPLFEAPERGESPAAISPGARSTGLLSRYGETHQE